MNLLKEKLQEQKHLEIIPFLLIPLTVIKNIDFIFIFVSMLMAVFSTKQAVEKRKETDGISYVMQNIVTDFLFLFYMISGYPAGITLAYLAVLICAYSTWKQNKVCAVYLAAAVSQLVMVIFVDPENFWNLEYSLLITVYNLSAILCFTSFFNYRTAVIIHFAFHLFLRIANIYYAKYRFATISIMDIFSLPTFFSIAGDYDFTPSKDMIIYIIICIILTVPLLLIKNFKLNTRKILKPIFLICLISMFFVVGEQAYRNWQNVENRNIYFFDAFALSAVEQVNIILDCPDKASQEVKIQEFQADKFKENEIKPHIITIMSESYADIVKALDLEVEKNPLQDMYDLDGTYSETGTVRVNTVGGGTSVSEWGYLTGLNCADFSVLRIPYATDVNTNYSFTADPLYSDYQKVFVHPFRSSGWNRMHVYDIFEYDRVIFDEDMDPKQEDYIRGYISDDYLTKHIITQIETAETPLFSMNVSMQNHGGYHPGQYTLDTPAIEIKNDELSDEDREKAELFLQLENLTTEALINLVNYLEDHPEHPTLLIFFGDHYPSDIKMPESSVGKSYETPYFVYCNYKNLDTMPEHMDLSLLLPNAKKAAGLPLSSWEKYLLSLNGNTANREMILARIKYGAF